MDEGEVVAPGRGQLEGEPGTALNTEACVDRALRGYLGGRPFAQPSPLSGIRALRILTHDGEVDRHPGTDADRGLERTQVYVQVELEAQPQQQAALEHPGRYVGRPHGPQKYGVEASQLLEHAVGQYLAGGQVALGPEVVTDGFQVGPGGACDLQRFGDDLRADAVSGDHGDAVSRRAGAQLRALLLG